MIELMKVFIIIADNVITLYTPYLRNALNKLVQQEKLPLVTCVILMTYPKRLNY